MRVSNWEHSQKKLASFIIFFLVFKKKSRKYKAREIMLIKIRLLLDLKKKLCLRRDFKTDSIK